LQATRAIRARADRLPSTPIIAFTANAFPEDIAACREVGMNDLVVKPARKRAMVEAILRVLPEPAPVTDLLPEYRGPPLAPIPSAPAIAVAALDREVFKELAREIGDEAAFEVLAVFTEETAGRLKLLRQLSIQHDSPRIGREAHSLKSAAGTFGYCELASLALRLERETAQLTGLEYRDILDSMDAAYAAATASGTAALEHS
jgi:HPt (histidine-containing phosphotransfer) domain-containing protein